MVDHQFADPRLAALYDGFCGREQRADLAFYLPLVLAADAVLDVGCGTGALLHWAREAGHAGRLCGLDPAAGMLEQARRRADVEWVQGDLSAVAWEREFDLVVMTGHAFQVLLEDDEIRASLSAVRAALAEGGRFAFETRNPAAREWRGWRPGRVAEAVAPDGAPVRMTYPAPATLDGQVVSFSVAYTSPAWDRPEVSASRLRFVDAPSLRELLAAAGLAVEAQYGDWDRSALGPASPEIITVARPLEPGDASSRPSGRSAGARREGEPGSLVGPPREAGSAHEQPLVAPQLGQAKHEPARCMMSPHT